MQSYAILSLHVFLPNISPHHIVELSHPYLTRVTLWHNVSTIPSILLTHHMIRNTTDDSHLVIPLSHLHPYSLPPHRYFHHHIAAPMSSSRNSPPDTTPADYHINHPIRPPTLTICERGASFTDSNLPSGHVYMTTTTPKNMRPATHDLTHDDTIRLSAPSANLPPVTMRLNDIIINQTL